jgi:hypothetical protein
MKWFAIVGAVVLVGTVAILSVWRPWVAIGVVPRPTVPAATEGASFTPLPVNLNELVDPAKMVTLVCVNKSGRACRVTVAGGFGSLRGRTSAELPAGETPSSMMISGPYTIETITVERDGKSHRQDMNFTLSVGLKYDVRVSADDTVEVIPKTK